MSAAETRKAGYLCLLTCLELVRSTAERDLADFKIGIELGLGGQKAGSYAQAWVNDTVELTAEVLAGYRRGAAVDMGMVNFWHRKSSVLGFTVQDCDNAEAKAQRLMAEAA